MHRDEIQRVKEFAASELVNSLAVLREHAERAVEQQVDSLIESGAAMELTADEIDLISSYRRFVARSKPDAIFKWKSVGSDQIVVPAPPSSLIIHPRDVSEHKASQYASALAANLTRLEG